MTGFFFSAKRWNGCDASPSPTISFAHGLAVARRRDVAEQRRRVAVSRATGVVEIEREVEEGARLAERERGQGDDAVVGRHARVEVEGGERGGRAVHRGGEVDGAGVREIDEAIRPARRRRRRTRTKPVIAPPVASGPIGRRHPAVEEARARRRRGRARRRWPDRSRTARTRLVARRCRARTTSAVVDHPDQRAREGRRPGKRGADRGLQRGGHVGDRARADEARVERDRLRGQGRRS